MDNTMFLGILTTMHIECCKNMAVLALQQGLQKKTKYKLIHDLESLLEKLSKEHGIVPVLKLIGEVFKQIKSELPIRKSFFVNLSDSAEFIPFINVSIIPTLIRIHDGEKDLDPITDEYVKRCFATKHILDRITTDFGNNDTDIIISYLQDKPKIDLSEPLK